MHKEELLEERKAIALTNANKAATKAHAQAEKRKAHSQCTLQSAIANDDLNDLITEGRSTDFEVERQQVLNSLRVLQEKKAPSKSVKLVRKQQANKRKQTEASIMGTKIKQQAGLNDAARFCSFLWGSQSRLNEEERALDDQIRQQFGEQIEDDGAAVELTLTDDENDENVAMNMQNKRPKLSTMEALDFEALDVHTLQQMVRDNSREISRLQQENETIKKIVEQKMATFGEAELIEQRNALLEQLAMLDRVSKTSGPPPLVSSD